MSSPRWMLAMLLAASCTRPAAAPPPPPARPTAANTGAAVARVMLWEGAPRILAAGQTLEPQVDLELQEGDVLEIPVDGLLVLRLLANGYVVKVDEDLVLPVKDLALLKAPPTPKTIEQQLLALQAANEIRADRVTAYQNRKVAGGERKAKADLSTRHEAAAAPAAPAPAAMDEAKKEPPARRPAEPSAKSLGAPGEAGGEADQKIRRKSVLLQDAVEQEKEPRPQLAGISESKAPAPLPARPESAGEEAKSSEPEGGQPAGPSWGVLRGGATAIRQDALPAEIGEALGDLAALKDCVKSAWTEARLPAGGTEYLLLRVEGNKVHRVKLGSGLPTPACVPALQQKAADIGGDGWIRVAIALD